MVKLLSTVLSNIEVRWLSLLCNMCFVVHSIMMLWYIVNFVTHSGYTSLNLVSFAVVILEIFPVPFSALISRKLSSYVFSFNFFVWRLSSFVYSFQRNFHFCFLLYFQKECSNFIFSYTSFGIYHFMSCNWRVDFYCTCSWEVNMAGQ